MDERYLLYPARNKLLNDFARYCRVCDRRESAREFLDWLQDIRKLRLVPVEPKTKPEED